MDKKLLEKILLSRSDNNIRFNELTQLLGNIGFKMRIKGDHHIFYKEGVVEILNIQPLSDGKAKAYQVKQVRNILIAYKLYEGRRF